MSRGQKIIESNSAARKHIEQIDWVLGLPRDEQIRIAKIFRRDWLQVMRGEHMMQMKYRLDEFKP